MVSRNGLANKAGSNQSEGLGVHLADFSIGGPGEIWVGEPKGSKIVVSNWWSVELTVVDVWSFDISLSRWLAGLMVGGRDASTTSRERKERCIRGYVAVLRVMKVKRTGVTVCVAVSQRQGMMRICKFGWDGDQNRVKARIGCATAK
jgi:hypothetical protein